LLAIDFSLSLAGAWVDRRRATKMWLCLFQGGGGGGDFAPPEKFEMSSLSDSCTDLVLLILCDRRNILNLIVG